MEDISDPVSNPAQSASDPLAKSAEDEAGASDSSAAEDLSSLIEPPRETGSFPAAPEATGGTGLSEPQQPVQFESLEEFSHETPLPPAEPEEPAPSGLDMSLVDTPQPEPQAETQPGIDAIKEFSEKLGSSLSSSPSSPEAQVAASFPFTLKIEGKLSPEEAEKLLSALTRENMGFREVDLEPQIADGRILIPRISEYAGVLLLQALRGIQARVFFGPSDEIFSTPETREEASLLADPQASGGSPAEWGSRDGASGLIPVTNSDTLPQFARAAVIDTVVASGLLSTRAVEASGSEEYELLLEGLIRELRYKAHRRGANGILAMRVQLTPLTLPTDYRLTVTGTAVLGT